MNQSLDELRKRPHLSVSAMKMMVACGRKFELHYVERAEASHRPIALVFGHAFHEVVGRMLWLHQRGRHLDRRALREHFEAALIQEIQSDGPPVLFEDGEDVPVLVSTAMRMLEALLAKIPLPDGLLHVELPFRVDLVDPATGEVLPLPLIGALDALFLNDDQLDIWEMKSAARVWPPAAVAFDFQMTAYRMAARTFEALPQVREPHLTLIVATKTREPDVLVERLVRTRRDEIELLETAVAVHRTVEAGAFLRRRDWKCASCEYAEVCS